MSKEENRRRGQPITQPASAHDQPCAAALRSVVIVGCGAVGSCLAGMIARMPAVARIRLVDFDAFENKNVMSQQIDPSDVGEPKAAALAHRLRRIRPGLEIAALVSDVEDLPRGMLRADVVLCCVDSRRARQVTAEICWRLGVPLIDAAVATDALLARVNLYVPNPEEGCCLTCNWSDADFNLVEQTYPCADAPHTSTPTDAPLALAALAASLQALECGKLLDGGPGRLLVGRELMVDARWHQQYVSEQRRNPDCRFDHRVWRIEPVAETATLGTALALAESPPDAGDSLVEASICVEGKAFAARLTCAACGRVSAGPRLVGVSRGFGTARTPCLDCGGELLATGFETTDRLVARELPAAVLRLTLSQVGLVSGEIFSLRGRKRERHFEVVAASSERNGQQVEQTVEARK